MTMDALVVLILCAGSLCLLRAVIDDEKDE